MKGTGVDPGEIRPNPHLIFTQDVAPIKKWTLKISLAIN